MNSPAYRIYWQPGCTSCLRAKEFLRSAGIDFESINVRERPEALAELAARGLRAVPVIARGADYVLGQDLDELALFIGVPVARERLTAKVLCLRIERLLEIAAVQTAQLPRQFWQTLLPQRDRSYLDLGYHIAMVATALVDAAEGGELTFEHYERRTPAAQQTAAEVALILQHCRARFRAWHGGTGGPPGPLTLRTYFGRRDVFVVLERTAWHIAQHVRQLQYLLTDVAGLSAADALSAADLAGLPVPTAVWDREIGAPARR